MRNYDLESARDTAVKTLLDYYWKRENSFQRRLDIKPLYSSTDVNTTWCKTYKLICFLVLSVTILFLQGFRKWPLFSLSSQLLDSMSFSKPVHCNFISSLRDPHPGWAYTNHQYTRKWCRPSRRGQRQKDWLPFQKDFLVLVMDSLLLPVIIHGRQLKTRWAATLIIDRRPSAIGKKQLPNLPASSWTTSSRRCAL